MLVDTARYFARPIRRTARRFSRGEGASMSAEAAIIAPLLFWAFLATFAYFDVYRVRNVALKSNYAISDLLSREENVIDMNYINGVRNLYRYLTQTDSSSWVRVSVVYCKDGCAVSPDATSVGRTLALDWSKATDGNPTFSDDDINTHFDDIIPIMAEDERVIVVETHMAYDPPFAAEITGLGNRTFNDIVMTRPRFANRLCFLDIDCGVPQ